MTLWITALIEPKKDYFRIKFLWFFLDEDPSLSLCEND